MEDCLKEFKGVIRSLNWYISRKSSVYGKEEFEKWQKGNVAVNAAILAK